MRPRPASGNRAPTAISSASGIDRTVYPLADDAQCRPTTNEIHQTKYIGLLAAAAAAAAAAAGSALGEIRFHVANISSAQV